MSIDNKKLLTYARHRHVVERYHYWSEVERRREDDVMQILMYEEVFLSEKMIYQILKNFQQDPERDRLLNSLCISNPKKQKQSKTNQLGLFGE